MAGDELENLKHIINGVALGQASVAQELKSLKETVSRVMDQVSRDIDNGHKIHGDHAVSLAELKKDTGGLWSVVRTLKESDVKVAGDAETRVKDHEESHWRWAGLIVGIVTVIVMVIELFFKH